MADDPGKPHNRKAQGFMAALVAVSLIGIGAVGLIDQLNHSQDQAAHAQDQAALNRQDATVRAQSECLKQYLSGAAPLAQALTDAQQVIYDDIAAGQTLDRTDPAAVKAATVKFYRDIAAEQAAAADLKQYRATHLPSKECP